MHARSSCPRSQLWGCGDATDHHPFTGRPQRLQAPVVVSNKAAAMNVTETRADGLKRQFKVVVSATDLESRLSGELEQMKAKVQIPGFRPGKVPVTHLRRIYGKSVMADVLQTTINEANRKIIGDNNLKLANEPQVNFPEDPALVEQVITARGDLEYTVDLEVLPSFELANISDITLTRLNTEVDPADVDAAIERMAQPNRPFTPKDGPAENGDKVTMSFVGRIDGTVFEGGSGEDIDVVIGSGSFIPGFEAQLIGMSAGEQRVVNVTFPPNYTAEHLAGKDAAFDVTATVVSAPGELAINDDLAKQYGMDSLDALRDAVRGSIGGDLARVSRRKIKRQLLDALDKKYTFLLPESLLEQEFKGIWANVLGDMQTNKKTFEDEGTSEEAARADYRAIAERRVRLGLVLAEIGEKAAIQVSDDEVSQALVARAREFPGQEKQVWEYYRKNPQALAELRAPIFEEKVVDHLLGQVTINDVTVSKEDLLKDDDDEKAGSDAT
jgi:trigger factor